MGIFLNNQCWLHFLILYFLCQAYSSAGAYFLGYPKRIQGQGLKILYSILILSFSTRHVTSIVDHRYIIRQAYRMRCLDAAKPFQLGISKNCFKIHIVLLKWQKILFYRQDVIFIFFYLLKIFEKCKAVIFSRGYLKDVWYWKNS